LETDLMVEEKGALTQRELEIARAVATGATNQQIARDLVISVNTVKVHLKNIFAKLDIQSRTEVALYAVKEGLVEVEGPVAAEEESGSESAPIARQRISLSRRVILVATVIFAAMLLMLPRVEMSSVPEQDNEFLDVRDSAAQGAAPVQLQRWESLAPLPGPRSRLAAVYYQGRILVIGGDTAAGTTGAVEEYDLSTNSWRARAGKPTPVNNVGAALIGGKVYVPGGYSGEEGVVALLEIYDPEADSWEIGTPMPLRLCAYAISVAEGKLYVFGGWNGSTYVASTLEYDPLYGTWSEQTPMSSPRGFASAGAIERRIYVVGGYDGQREFATVEEYDPAEEGHGDPWCQRTPLSMRRGGLGVAAVAGSLYAIGGGWNRYLAFNERYDPRLDQWSPLETPVSGQWRNLAVVAGEMGVYALGGWNGDFMDANYEYQALFTYYLPEVP
jgi:DNA-binding CsgD family transcriptional regulator